MREAPKDCAVCGAGEASGAGMSRVIIEGRALWLCLDHATAVAVAMPRTFEQMRALFVLPGGDVARRAAPMIERRSPIDRRRSDDRRAFPPRPEGRRMGYGRRVSDPAD